MKKTPSIPAAGHAESTLFANIRTLIESARNTVARGVDLVQVHTILRLVGTLLSLNSKARAARNTARKCSRAWLNA